MNKFFDYLDADLPMNTIQELLKYIRNFVTNMGGDIPVVGNMGNLDFCATPAKDGSTRIHWVQIGQNRIAIDALV